MKRTRPFFFLFLLTVIGCSSGNRLSEYETDSSCSATIEGEVIEELNWRGDAPLLVTRTVGRDHDYRKGEIVELTDDGVIFNETRSSIAYNPEPREFKKNQIVSLIDEDGEIIMGEYPAQDHVTNYYQLEIQRVQSDEKPKKFRLYPGKTFAYCADPGEYTVENLIWVRNSGDKDISAEEFKRKITIKENSANYLGLFTVNSNTEIEGSQKIRIPVKILERPKRTGGWIAAFGAVGGVIDAVSRDRGIVGFLDLDITRGNGHQSKTGWPVTHTALQEVDLTGL